MASPPYPAGNITNRAVRAGYWLLPSLLCLTIYWLGLRTWFWQDDFAWLGLSVGPKETGKLWTILFAPMAQGTIRPLSERAFFLVFYSLFGLNGVPYRMMAFATQMANLVLLALVARRLTGSRAAGFWAPVFWVVNSVLVRAMSWNSAYNQILCAFFLLLAFYYLLRHIETGKTRFLVGEWISFIAGFGALELMVLYPALAFLYALCRARGRLVKTLWMFPVSAAYAALHWYVAPKTPASGYRMEFDASVFSSLWTYWQWALGPARIPDANLVIPNWVVQVGTAVLSLCLLGFAAWKLRRKEWLAGFLLGWFVIVLAPVLPLRDHLSVYYLTIPTIGLAVLGAWGFCEAWQRGGALRTVSLLAATAYLAASLPVARYETRWDYENARAARTLVRGVARARELHPGKVILLTGVNGDLFWTAIVEKPFRLVGVTDVYLVPGSEESIEARPGLDQVSDYELPPGPALKALEENRAVVYAVGSQRLTNVTPVFRALARDRWHTSQEPRRVDAGSPLFEGQLGPTWYWSEGTYRWMPKQATVPGCSDMLLCIMLRLCA